MKKHNKIVAVLVSLVLIFSSFIGSGVIGVGAFTAQSEIVLNPFVKVVACGTHSLALKADGTLWGWGSNLMGELGGGTGIAKDFNLPKQINMGYSGKIKEITGGSYHSFAIKEDGSLWGWGHNQYYQLGNGTSNNAYSPTQLISSGVKAVSTSSNHTVMLKTDGSLWVWGQNTYGQLGDGTTIQSKTPKQIISSGVKMIDTSHYNTAIIKDDGSVWIWGRNDYYQVGDGTTAMVTTPKQILAGGVKSISLGSDFTYAIKDDGSLWGWGKNDYGQLNDAVISPKTIPTQILTNSVKEVSTGGSFGFIIKTDNSLWGCGKNIYGQLGDSTAISRDSFVQIFLSDVQTVTAGGSYAHAIKTDGTFWTWGYNYNGQVGDGTTNTIYTPIKFVQQTIQATIAKGKFAVISNESVDTVNSASTGSFSLDNSTSAINSNLVLAAYKMDYVKPVDAAGLSKYSINTMNKTLKTQISYASYTVGATKTFWTVNFETQNYVSVTATLKSSGTYSNVWVKTTDYNMSTTDANKITAEMDSKIYPRVTDVFGQPSDVDENNKVDILCFDIQDGFSGSGGYIGGYFYPGDLYAYDDYYNPCTNQMEVFYIDTYPAMGISGTKDVTKCYDTIAHEFQHMINYNTNVFVEQNADMDTWLNEAFSEAASQIYSGQISQDRIDYYNYSDSITSGFSLLDWAGELENYSLSYLFAEYLKEQVGIGDSVFTEVLQDTYNDYRAVENVIKKYIDPNLTFVKFMTYFRAALLLKKPTGLYGFHGNAGYNTINQKIYTGGPVNLYGGGAVVIKADPVTGDIYVPSDKGATVNYLIIENLPVITLLPYQTTLTNQDITVTATTDVGTLNTATHIFTENGSFDFIATNSQGDITTKTVVITNIDKVHPVISGVTNGTSYRIATVNFNEGTALLNGVSCVNGSYIRNAGVYDLIVTDLAGNSSAVSFSVNNTAFLYSDGYISRISLGMTSDLIKGNTNIFVNETVKIFDKNNVEKLNSEIVGTGMTIKILNGSIINSTYVAVIYGDISGDGDVSVVDLTTLKKHLLKTQLLNGVYKEAADIFNVGYISVGDLLAIKKHILGIELIKGTGWN